MTDKYVNLHCHSYYSLLDGVDSPENLVLAAKANGQSAIAVTDHGTLAGHRELYKAGKQHGVKPIFGLEAYISPTDRFDKRSKAKRSDDTDIYNHIILLAKSQTGYENISKMSQIAWEEGYYYKPRIDTDLLMEYSEGVIVLSGCLNGIPAKAIEEGRPELGLEWLRRLQTVFGDDLYVEVQAHNPVEINRGLVAFAEELGLKLAATSDCHRAYESDKDLQEAFLILSTSPKQDKSHNYTSTQGMNMLERLNTLWPDRKMSFQDFNLFVQSQDQIDEDFRKAGFDATDAIEETSRIADKVGEYEFYADLDLLPEPADNPFDELEFQCLEAMKDKGLTERRYYEQLEEEMRVIKKKNFSSYFLIVEEMVNWAKGEGILVGPGRGSAAGSLICYLLGITNVDPLDYSLLFSRFINEERNDYPDIDVDFQRRHRGKVKQHLADEYTHVASIVTYTYFTDKQVIADAAKVLGVPYGQVKRLNKNVESFEDFEDSDNDVVAKFRTAYPDVLKLARRLRGRIRGSGIHAGGIVVSKEPINKYAPIETRDDTDGDGRVPVVALNMDEVAEIGLIKLDVLGLKTLDVVADTLEAIGMTSEELFSVDLNDPAAIAAFNRGDTVGVFQTDTAPYRRLLQEMDIRSFEDIAASNALVRPGAMNTVGPEYISRSRGKSRVSYVHDSLKEILGNTYGTIIYQEQVMQTAVILGEMSWAQADKLRKIIGKKQNPAEFAQYKGDFMDGATKHISRTEANKLWHDFEAHAGYSFNRSHAVAYSMLSLQTMWLRLNYPLEYMTAVLRNEDDKAKLARYLIDVKNMGIPVYFPNINESEPKFHVHNDGIRFGLANLKYISDKAYARIAKHRPYGSVEELKAKSAEKYSGISSRAVTSMELTGALKPIGGPDPVEDELYDYMSLPTFTVPEFRNEDLVTPLDEYDEDDTMLLSGMVQKIKRGQGWSLIDIIDDTGTAAFFDKQDTEIVKGNYYYFIIANKRVVKAVSADELVEQLADESNETALTRYLSYDTMDLLGKKSKYLLAARARETRSGSKMADLIVADEDGLESYTVFPGDFNRIVNTIKVGSAYDFKVSQTKRGGYAAKDVR